MRALKSVLVMAGALKRQNPDKDEDVVLIRALRDSNLPKFLKDDAVLFQAILSDLFPGVEIPEHDYGRFQEEIESVTEKRGLQVVSLQVGLLAHFTQNFQNITHSHSHFRLQTGQEGDSALRNHGGATRSHVGRPDRKWQDYSLPSTLHVYMYHKYCTLVHFCRCVCSRLSPYFADSGSRVREPVQREDAHSEPVLPTRAHPRDEPQVDHDGGVVRRHR